MLERLLDLLATGGVHTPAQLANRLGVSEGLVEQMLAHLARVGYLRPITSTDCRASASGNVTHCSHCPLASTCTIAGADGRAWALTDKAHR